jgi:hypothetical protein
MYLSVCPWFCLLQEEAGDDAEERVVEYEGDHEAAAHRGQGRSCEGRHQLTLNTKRCWYISGASHYCAFLNRARDRMVLFQPL